MRTAAALAACVVATALLSRPAISDDDVVTVTHVIVPLADVDLNYPDGEDEMFARIEDAAAFACGPRPDIRDRENRRLYRRCMAEAIADALAQVDAAYDQ